MRSQHVDPTEAVRIHQDVGARQSIGIHWGTFELTDESLDAPLGDVPAALQAAGLPPTALQLLAHGQTLTIRAPRVPW
jgi:L-ascorbate metabolism protein UlaG (beta-lactamase superfamily)